MKLDRNDRMVTGLAILVVGVFVTTWQGWGVPLIGDSHRWATIVILLLGLAAGALSSPGSDPRSYLLATLVIAAFLFAVLALATGSLAPLALLVVALLGLIVESTERHVRHGRGQHVGHEGTTTAAP
jgi:predicted small integral membrane protein